MTKKELAKKIKENGHSSASLADVERLIDAVFKEITTELRNGGKYTQLGFGVFAVKARAARKGRNPRTGETVTIPARKVVSFTVGKTLKGAAA